MNALLGSVSAHLLGMRVLRVRDPCAGGVGAVEETRLLSLLLLVEEPEKYNTHTVISS